MSAEPSPVDEFVTFLQHQLPGLEDGTYDLELSASVEDVSDQSMERSYRFAVTGDRFSFADPAATVSSTFPALNATGRFETALAHVVLNGATLPWARSPIPNPPPRAEVDVDADVPTWLAVLVFDDDDVAAFPGLTLSPTTRVLGDLFPAAAYPDTTLGTDYSYFEGATTTHGRLEVDETVADPVQTIEVPLALWAQVAPTLADLELTAHVRSLSVENKPVALGAGPPADPIGTFAIVVGNRLPAPDKRSYAFLVSLEGLREVLPATSDGGTLTDPGIDIGRNLRLAVLSQWSFNTKGGSAAFVERLERLNGRTPDDPADAVNTNLRLDRPQATPPISGALAAGYVPLDHELRTDETTVSWYRGPLSPIDRPSPVLPRIPISSPDEALMFDPTTGLLDASLAAAWTIGRLLALQDRSYATALYQFKRGLMKATVEAIERELLAEILGRPEFASGRDHAVLHATMDLLRNGGDSA